MIRLIIETEDLTDHDLDLLRRMYGTEVYVAERCDYDVDGVFGKLTEISAG